MVPSIILVAFTVLVHAQELVVHHTGNAEKSVNQLAGKLSHSSIVHVQNSKGTKVDRLVNGLLSRVLEAGPLHHADLDDSMLGKPGNAATKTPPSASTADVPFDQPRGAKWAKWLRIALVAGATLAAGKVVIQFGEPLPQKWLTQTRDSKTWKKLTHTDFVEPDRLMAKKGRTVAECERAASLYRTMLEQVDPSSPEATTLRLRTADALNAVIRMSTNGNLMMIDGLQDTPEHKRTWSRFAPGAAKLSKAAWDSSPSDPKACSVYAEASMYEGSAKGIVRNALTGGAQLFLRNARALQKWPQEESGFGLVLEGAFHLTAPRPLKNNKKGLELFQKATTISKTRRNLYHAGLAHFRLGEMKLAVEAWQKCLAASPGSQNEADIAAYIAMQAQRGVKEAKKKQLST